MVPRQRSRREGCKRVRLLTTSQSPSTELRSTCLTSSSSARLTGLFRRAAVSVALISSPHCRRFKAQNSKHKLSLEEWRNTTVSFDSIVGIYAHLSFTSRRGEGQ